MIILTGASASGKTEVGKLLASLYNIKKVITYTTREIRVSETNGIDYHFISNEEFESLNDKGFFFETMSYNGNMYGTSYESLKDDSYVILDFNGLKKYKESSYTFTSFYLDCSSDERYNRMIKRGDGHDKALKRLEVDKVAFTKEIESYVDYVIDTTDLDIDEVASLVYKKSHSL